MSEPRAAEFKAMLKEMRSAFSVAIRDGRRWLVCFAELLISGAFLAVDQLTKRYVYGACLARPNKRIELIPGVICFYATENTGASFGIFRDATVALAAISLVCSFLLLIFVFYTYKRRNPWLRVSLILILAGAVGNVVDRLAFGCVRDFVYFELIDFAVFNFADSCLTVGTIVLLVYVLLFYAKEEKLRASNGAEPAKSSDLGPAAVARDSEPVTSDSAPAETAIGSNAGAPDASDSALAETSSDSNASAVDASDPAFAKTSRVAVVDGPDDSKSPDSASADPAFALGAGDPIGASADAENSVRAD